MNKSFLKKKYNLSGRLRTLNHGRRQQPFPGLKAVCVWGGGKWVEVPQLLGTPTWDPLQPLKAQIALLEDSRGLLGTLLSEEDSGSKSPLSHSPDFFTLSPHLAYKGYFNQ